MRRNLRPAQSRTSRDGKPVWIRPRRGVRGGAPAARCALYRYRPAHQNRSHRLTPSVR
ncbi:hypothetical protein MKSMC1_57200 [Mycobacterium kansasii]|nr:hypothetical protein MKSMC1_57200 [Mycobacterium kansasii]